MKTYLINKFSSTFFSAGALTGALLFSFFLNFVFNAYLGRVLSFTEFGIITFIGSFWLILGVFCNSLGLTLNHVIVRLAKKKDNERIALFFSIVKKKITLITIGIIIAVTVLSIPINTLFSLSSPFVVIALSTLFYLGVITAANKGYLQSFFKFSNIGLILITEAILKLLLAFIFVQFTDTTLVYLSIPLSALGAYMLSEYFLPKMNYGKTISSKVAFPTHFYIASVLTVLSTTLLFTSDVILAKMYLSPEIAGQYALLSLIGKMIYFFGSLLNTIFVPYLNQRNENTTSDKKVFYLFLFAASALIFAVYTGVGLLGPWTLPIVFGSKVFTIEPYLLSYATAIALFTLANVFVIYHLMHNRYIFPFIALTFSVIVIGGIVLHHSSIHAIVQVLFTFSILSFTTIVFMHVNTSLRNYLETKLLFLKTAYDY